MQEFKYTDNVVLNSSLVQFAWYDAKTSTLVLQLNGYRYKYSDVPKYVYSNLIMAASAGRYYNTSISGHYKRSTHLGRYTDSLAVRRPAEVPVVKNPDLAVYKSGAIEAKSVTVAPLRLSLSKDVAPVVQYDEYEVTFTLSDGQMSTDERFHTVRADSEDSAIEQVIGLLKKVTSQSVTVVSVTHYFN